MLDFHTVSELMHMTKSALEVNSLFHGTYITYATWYRLLIFFMNTALFIVTFLIKILG